MAEDNENYQQGFGIKLPDRFDVWLQMLKGNLNCILLVLQHGRGGTSAWELVTGMRQADVARWPVASHDAG